MTDLGVLDQQRFTGLDVDAPGIAGVDPDVAHHHVPGVDGDLASDLQVLDDRTVLGDRQRTVVDLEGRRVGQSGVAGVWEPRWAGSSPSRRGGQHGHQCGGDEEEDDG
jgi:hypothetical protein